ncbi:uncharacterized protein SETTUDRAFT_18012 [Exserohilum turcica Et28A]|uniref:Uncharacterized protein n=1 Tax=Exserohilum turcicum (strain 28A) TaxID=671987 RepID=R0J2W2_EXST2|nr:uncharacterized protein SETTUDRAFT_18012 [Exserohilum turcica Et28A]EOA91315.1 hypothetical protein SETTUDRAFT_18012 [Exserohilum turcica Et28A]
MAGPPAYPADSHPSSPPSPPSVSSQSNVAFTPSATSVADSSDNEFEPTPVHSPGGPQYEDLPPSYEDARHQAVHDARNGIAPIDPNQIEAHRITLSQGPSDPEIWEYRVRGEQTDPASEQEHAPDYANHTSDKATSVPVQHVSSVESIPVGRMRSELTPPSTTSGLASTLLSQALEFTRHPTHAAPRHSPHLNRIIAIPGEGGTDRPAGEYEQFLCAYTQTLHGHAVEPDQFLDFLRGLNVLLRSTNTTANDLLQELSGGMESSSLVSQYIRGANEAFFAPRGLRVSFRSEAAILAALPLPTGPGQRDAIANRLVEEPRSAAIRAQRFTPWIEPLNIEKLPAPGEHMHRLHELGERFAGRTPSAYAVPRFSDNTSSQSGGSRATSTYENPPHSVPTPSEETQYGHGQQSGFQRGNWSPFGAPGFGPFGPPGNGPFGPAGYGPFGAPGNGPFGGPGRGPFGGPGRGPFGAAGNGPFGRRGRGCGAPGPSRQGDYSVGKEWADVGKEIGKIGEEFGKMIGDLGMQFGQQANRLGMNVQRATSGSGSQQQSAPRTNSYRQPTEDLPPSYEPASGQESGVLRGDHKIQPDYTASKTEKGKNKARDMDDDDDDDASSTSSESSDSDSDSESDDMEEYYDAQNIFDKRVRSIEEAATRGNQSAEQASRERASVQQERQRLKEKFDVKQSKRTVMRNLKKRGRELKKQHRQRKKQLRASSDDGKGKGKAKKSKEWKVEKRSYKEKRKELRREKLAAKKEWRKARQEWREARSESRKMRRGVTDGDGNRDIGQDKLVWLVIENLGP